MSKNSEKVKRWRKRCKARIIEAMGGSCVVCKYVKCQSSLSLHHLDPSKKDFGMGAIRANPKNWISLVEELRKCVLVCSNCHGEIHEGISFVPNDAAQFNEAFADYKSLEKSEDILTPCPMCGKLKADYLKNCSVYCAAISKYRVDWNSIDLFSLLKEKSIVSIAEELGCSDSAVHKRIRKMIYDKKCILKMLSNVDKKEELSDCKSWYAVTPGWEDAYYSLYNDGFLDRNEKGSYHINNKGRQEYNKYSVDETNTLIVPLPK